MRYGALGLQSGAVTHRTIRRADIPWFYVCTALQIGHKNAISGSDSCYEQGLQFIFFKGEVKASLEPTGSQLPLARNNPHFKVVYLEEACFEPLQTTLC